jgi:hypothetical protein
MDRAQGSRFAPAACSMCCGDVSVARGLNGWRSVCLQCGDERVAPFRLQPSPPTPAISAGVSDFRVSPHVIGHLRHS